MKLNKERITARGIRFSIEEGGVEISRARLYIMNNDLHEESFGFVEDVFVKEGSRSYGYGSKLIQEMVEEAKRLGCYKIIATSRKSRKNVHRFYKKNGFEKYGHEFRLNLK